MPRKVSTPIKQQSFINEEISDWDKLILRINKGDYILVVGNDIVLSKEQYPEFNGNSKDFLLQETIEGLKAEERLGKKYSCATFSQLSEDIPSLHKTVANKIFERIDFSIEDVSNDLIKLLNTRCFRVILTTTFDPFVEIAMKAVWGRVRVMNIFDTIGKNNDLLTNEQLISEYYDTIPTLFYAFGQVGKEREYVLTDNDAIKVMTKWLNPKVQEKFKKYISQKRILAIGCKLDDWLFRFFWYALQQDISNLKKGEVAITLDPMPGTSDAKLQEYLHRHEVVTYNDAHKFITELNNGLENINLRFKNIDARKKLGGIFLSYAHEDLTIVSQIFERLVDEGFSVWLDNEKLGKGDHDNYNQRIEQAIGECRVFIPIFSAQTKKDYEEGKTRYYKKTEWRLAVNSIKKHHIRPIQLNGYNCRSEYHKKICEGYDDIYNSTCFDLYSNPFKDYINNISDLLQEQE